MLGTEDLYDYIDKYNIELDPRFNDILGRWVPVWSETWLSSREAPWGAQARLLPAVVWQSRPCPSPCLCLQPPGSRCLGWSR